MKRGWTYSLCLAVAAATASPALADVNVQLNLRYTNPNDANGGGTWDLLVKSTATNGMAGISVNLNGNLGVTGTDLPAAIITPNAQAFDNATSVFRYSLFGGGQTQIVAGDDLVAGNLVVGVGTPTFAGRTVQDDLFTNAATTDPWDNSTRIASGSWTGARPTFGTIDANEFNATNQAIAATIGTMSVRGDSVGVDGLKPGDADRSGSVGSGDFIILANNFGAGTTWDQGNFDGAGTVGSGDFIILANNFGGTTPSPAASGAVGAVPEPASIGLLITAACGILGLRRRS